MSDVSIVQVALALPKNCLFDYQVPNGQPMPKIGTRVMVPVRKQLAIGIVVKHAKQSKHTKLKAVQENLDEQAIITTDLLKLCEWAANYYQKPVGEVIINCLPSLLKSGKPMAHSQTIYYKLTENKVAHAPKLGSKQTLMLNLLHTSVAIEHHQLKQYEVSTQTIQTLLDKKLITRITKDTVAINNEPKQEFLPLNAEQKKVFNAILQHDNFAAYLLYGVTGSGKTEIYLQLAKVKLSHNQQVLVLIPEINLTPQTLLRFKQRFHQEIVVIHSNLSAKERLDAFIKVKTGIAKLVIGTRSALFTPWHDLGMIIIDEEHDNSYKQTEGFRYHARDLAIVLAKQLNIPILLASATPSAESFYNAKIQKYQLLTLLKRVNQAALPTQKILDMRSCKQALSPILINNIHEQLADNKQVLLLLNRRGFATLMLCSNCGWGAKCPRCDLALTYHQSNNRLICHHCSHYEPLIAQCPGCRLANLKPIGIGTEQLEQILQEEFSETPILRLDSDTTKKKGSFNKYLQAINSEQPMIMLGTQLLAKGHHFPQVSLVGILGVDHAFFSSDFNATEKIAQLIVQVSGRAGRSSSSSEVFIQTLNPDNPQLQELLNADYNHYLEKLLAQRKQAQLPPFTNQALFVSESTQPMDGYQVLQAVKVILKKTANWQIFGPVPALHERINNKYRHHLLVEHTNKAYLTKNLHLLDSDIKGIKKKKHIKIHLDVNPISLV